MRSVPLVLALALAASALAPLAAASERVCTPTVARTTACVIDATLSNGSCASQGYEIGYDSAYVLAPVGIVDFYGGSACTSEPGFTQKGAAVALVAFTPVLGVVVAWSHVEQSDASGSMDVCRVDVLVATSLGWNTWTEPCPAGLAPPEPGWGHLLP